MPIYLDHNATTPLAPGVLDAMLPFLKEEFGNASSAHQLGQRSRRAIEDARIEMARFINAEDPQEIIFTSGATEANNQAIKGSLSALRAKGRRVVSSAIEHSAVRTVVRHLGELGDIDNVVVPVHPNGIVDMAQLADAITKDTVLVSVMTANNETGVIQPVADIARLARDRGAACHTDAVQIAGKQKIDVRSLGVDMLSLSAHKFGGPKGAGILYARKGTRLHALLHGGHQEKNRRGGTENTTAIVGMAAAARHSNEHLAEAQTHVTALRDRLEELLLTKVPMASINGDLDRRVFNTTNIVFPYTDSTEMVMALDMRGLIVSAGSACAAGNVEASHVLLAMGLPQDRAHASIRFSLGKTTTADEIEQAAVITAETVDRLRGKNPLWKGA